MATAEPNKLTMRPFLAATKNFASGEDTPRAFLERCLATIAELEPAIGAFVELNPEGARAAADQSTARWRAGEPRSPIDGMPIGVKDIIETRDMPTQMGSPLYAGWRGERDAASVFALREAGAVVLGKTVTTEFATTEPRGATRNPHDPTRTPGGSSSGSAAAVAAGMLPAALGTQVVGSILRPASFCGCVGFKPSVGALNRGGSHDHLSQSCTGLLAATLEDAWASAREIARRAGGDPGYPRLAGPPMPAAQKPRSIAVLETAGSAVASAGAREELAAAVLRLRTAGIAIITRRDTPLVEKVETAISPALEITRAINDWEWRWPLNTYRERDSDGLSRNLLERLAAAEGMGPNEYEKHIATRARIRAQFAELAGICDAAVTLSARGAAPVGIGWTGDPIFVAPGSMLGVPTVSLPLLTDESLPLGLQVIGFAQQDAALVATAAAIRDVLVGRM